MALDRDSAGRMSPFLTSVSEMSTRGWMACHGGDVVSSTLITSRKDRPLFTKRFCILEQSEADPSALPSEMERKRREKMCGFEGCVEN